MDQGTEVCFTSQQQYFVPLAKFLSRELTTLLLGFLQVIQYMFM
uniref:Uncharacterized protein n=1 Tax=Rhizophora mucronata TaxID=61149 RepID=A0A2P2NN24_RHIMU